MLLDTLKRDIQDLHAGISLRPTLDHYRLIGEKLLQAKRHVTRGGWQDWLKSLGSPKIRQCQVYMQLAKTQSTSFSDTLDGFVRHVRAAKKAASRAQREEEIELAVAEMARLDSTCKILHKNNRRHDWPTLDHIFTDPPWEDIAQYEWLAGLAVDKLKQGGLLAVQCGTGDLSKVLPIFHRLEYVWTLAIVYQESVATTNTFLPNWRPILLFSKGKTRLSRSPVTDTVTIPGGVHLVKQYHPWQQPIQPYLKWIPALTQPGDLIADPFGCTGTVALACKLTGRRCISTEIDKRMVAVARKRLAEADDRPFG